MSQPEPVARRIGDEIYVAWPSRRLIVQFGHLMETRWGLQAEVSVQSHELGELAWGQVMPVSSESRGKIAKRLDKEWVPYWERACREAMAVWRRPPEWQELRPVTAGAVPWLWTDWIPANQTTILYGDGDSGKSLLALSLAVSTLSGLPLAGTWPVARFSAVLYVDYESTAEEHQHRLALLTRALEVPALTGLHYLQAARPLSDLGPHIRAQQQRTQAGLVVVDSLGAACAGEPESAQAAIAALNAMRELGPTVTRLVLAHVSKADAAQSGAARKAYGSVYVRNLPRASIEMRRDEGTTDGLSVTLRVDKSNLLHRRPAPVGLSLEVTEEGMVWRSTPGAIAGGTLRQRLLAALATTPDDARSVRVLCDSLEADPATVRRVLARMADDGLARRVSLGGKGQGDETLWIRIDRKRDSQRDSSETVWGDDPTSP